MTKILENERIIHPAETQDSYIKNTTHQPYHKLQIQQTGDTVHKISFTIQIKKTESLQSVLTQLNTPGAPGPAIRQTQRNPKIRIRERKKNNVSNIKSTSATSKCKTKHYETRLRKLPISRSCHGWAATERLDMHDKIRSFSLTETSLDLSLLHSWP